MPEFKRLRDDHDRIVVVSERLAQLIASDNPPPAAELYAVRMALASLLVRHLKSEDWVLYPRLLASDNPQVAATARAFIAEMGGLADSFKDHNGRWSAAAIEHDWRGYRRDTGLLIGILRRRVERENDELYPLFEIAGKAAA